MSLKWAIVWLQRCIVLFAIISTTWLYFYPVYKGCAFPSTTGSRYDAFKHTIAQHKGLLHEYTESLAPFRLLVLADPQLEGDSSLPDPEDALAARVVVYWHRLRYTSLRDLKDVSRAIVKELLFDDIPRAFWAARKTLDLFGNDYYLAHIYRTLHWWTKPTHVTVLGDLIGSQWVSDDEFEWRGWRYWNRVLAGSKPVDEETMTLYQRPKEEQKAIQLESQDADWSHKIINIVGNHDIGYAGDISESRISRFERVFGKVNWDIHFSYPEHRLPENHSVTEAEVPSLHLIVLNSMILDTPAFDESVQGNTYSYLNDLISSRLDSVEDRNSTFTLLLTHVPLHKPEGTCVDAPFFDFWDYTDGGGAFKSGGLKEQNHLSEHTSQSGVLEGLFGISGNADAPAGGRGRNGLILNGHDHAGCDVVHHMDRLTKRSLQKPQDADQTTFVNSDDTDTHLASLFPNMDFEVDVSSSWSSVRTELYQKPEGEVIRHEEGVRSSFERVASVREVTLRSMMGEYSGNAGLLSLWYDFSAKTWIYEIQMCSLGVQHIWWAVHVLDVVTVIIVLFQTIAWTIAFHRAPKSIPRANTIDTTATQERSRRALVDQRVEKVARTPGHARSPSERRRKG